MSEDSVPPNDEVEAVRPDVLTRFKVGNQAWRARSSHGRSPTFASPDQVWDAAVQYFEWNCANPLVVAEPVKFQGEGTLMEVPKLRAMTIDGLCNFLDIAVSTWKNFRDKPDFVAVCARVEQVIRQQKMEGAAADLLNAAIVARELGLVDRQEHDHKGAVEVTTSLETLRAHRARHDGDADA